MLVFGGIQFSTLEPISELRGFDLQKGKWYIVHAKGDVPGGRIGHVLLSCSSGATIMVGGVISTLDGSVQDNSLCIYHVRTQHWKRIALKQRSEPFSKRGKSDGPCLPYTGEKHIVFGSNVCRVKFIGRAYDDDKDHLTNETNTPNMEGELARLQR
ncbi:hypothetical protein DQ04_21911000 [Trypanosoma grayi]|uniref:hypothetical protein n=1 Tax=Trypanosoma grayi TaxID=71804 RepID=UPI0004F483BC|nr:hypothetical protein DQ04_21911000 [Trypanosoma grayi]KEG05447.1 hypothetical protein DQ04_21911000 [Trypanosoma grayi]